MALGREEREELRKYLLGELSPETQVEQLEERLLTDDEFFEEYEIVKDELMDAYLGGELGARELEQFEARFKSSPQRRRELKFASAFRRHLSEGAEETSAEPDGERSRPGLLWSSFARSPYTAAFASALLIIGLGFVAWRAFFYQSDIDKGMAALRASLNRQRYVEARVSGLDYAPLVQLRGGEGAPPDLERQRAERYLLDAAGKSSNAASAHALGQLFLSERKFGEAATQFQEALKSDAGNAKLHSDLGAALLEEGKEHLAAGDNSKSFEEFARSLEQFDAALAAEPRLPEALFNRALVLQYMALPAQAREAWGKYLEVDPNSAWAAEVKRKLSLLEESGQSPRGASQILDSFLNAYRDGEDEKAWEFLRQNREMISGKLIPWQLTANYLNYSLAGQEEDAGKALRALSYAADMEARKTDDPFFSQLYRYYASAPKSRLPELARAHALTAEGYGLCQQAKFSEALGRFEEARRLFKEAGDDCETGLAEYWVAYCYFQNKKADESLTAISDLSGRCESSGHKWMLAQTLSFTATIRAAMNNPSKALELSARALGIFEGLSDSYGIQKCLSQLGNLYRYLGSLNQSLGYIQRGLYVAQPFAYSPRQMWRNYETAMQLFYAMGLNAAALVYGHEALRLSRDEFRDPAATYLTYLHLGLVYSKLRKYDEALRLADEGLKVSRSLPDGGSKDGMVANSLLQTAHIRRYAGDYAEALREYDEAIASQDDATAAYQKYEAHKGRLLCHMNLGDDSAVGVELPEVLGLFEKYRSLILEEQNRNSFFDAEQDTYDVAIGYAYSHEHAPQQAFDYSEASRARSLLNLMKSVTTPEPAGASDSNPKEVSQPLPLTAIRERMPEGTQIVEYASLDDRLLIWVVSRDRFEVVEQKIGADELDASVKPFLASIENHSGEDLEETRRSARALYDILVSPVEQLLDSHKVLCVVPDKILNRFPFAALVSPRTGRYLIEDYALLFSPSSNVFLLGSEAAEQRHAGADEHLLVVGDPSFNRAAFPQMPALPAASTEAKKIADLYPGASALLGRDATKAGALGELGHADVAHFACHYVIDGRSPEMSRLVLSPARGDDTGELRTSEVLGADLKRTRLIVLSACHTAGDYYYKGEGMMGISRAFLASGVPVVVASQWDVDSDATAALMISFHKHRKTDKVSTSEALRRAQLEMLSGPDIRFRHPSFWAAFLPIGAYVNF